MTEGTHAEPTEQPPTLSPDDDSASPPYPDSPVAAFRKLQPWAMQFMQWSIDVEACYKKPCSTGELRTDLQELANDFDDWAERMYDWAMKVESCYKKKCGVIVEHERPPRPPFKG